MSDPTAVEDSELSNAAGAQLLRGAALKTLFRAVGEGALASGLLTDEFLANPPSPPPHEALNRRESLQYEELGSDNGYRLWQETRRAATIAMPKLRAYTSAPARVGEMFSVRAFAALRLAEDYCPGFPLYGIVDLKPVSGPPLSTEDALAQALADFDSAVSYAADTARILDLARVGRARTLLELGRFAEAGTAVAEVSTGYVAKAEYSNTFDPYMPDPLFFGLFGSRGQGLADREGGTGLDFVSARDPRVRADSLGMAADGVTIIYRAAKYPSMGAPIVLASGIEARLIEAEAALRTNPGSGTWLTILNALRTTCPDAATCPTPAPAGSGGVAGLPPLADPGAETARQDLLFRERAFWLFATGHRLADLRRLMRVYGRSAEDVFPRGTYYLGGAYGTATSIPFIAEKEIRFNPAVTGCTSR